MYKGRRAAAVAEEEEEGGGMESKLNSEKICKIQKKIVKR
jgi:hypothetical protein